MGEFWVKGVGKEQPLQPGCAGHAARSLGSGGCVKGMQGAPCVCRRQAGWVGLLVLPWLGMCCAGIPGAPGPHVHFLGSISEGRCAALTQKLGDVLCLGVSWYH